MCHPIIRQTGKPIKHRVIKQAGNLNWHLHVYWSLETVSHCVEQELSVWFLKWSPVVKLQLQACGENRLVSVCLKLLVTTSVWECRGHVVDRQSAGCFVRLSVCPLHAMTCNIMRSRDEMMDTREVMSSSRLTWCRYDLILHNDSFPGPGAVN